jgi:hypothetical protein
LKEDLPHEGWMPTVIGLAILIIKSLMHSDAFKRTKLLMACQAFAKNLTLTVLSTCTSSAENANLYESDPTPR